MPEVELEVVKGQPKAGVGREEDPKVVPEKGHKAEHGRDPKAVHEHCCKNPPVEAWIPDELQVVPGLKVDREPCLARILRSQGLAVNPDHET